MRRVFTVYGMSDSGNCYKVRLVLEQLGLAYRWIETDPTRGDTRTAGFLAMNPDAKVPVLGLPEGGFLCESNAILYYLAEGSALVPAGRLARGRMLQWMFFEQYSHEPYVAVARAIQRYQPPDSPRLAELPQLRSRGNRALGVMEKHLAHQSFFVEGAYSIADIALYAYTHCAGDGGFELSRFPAVCLWLERVRAQPRHVRLAA